MRAILNEWMNHAKDWRFEKEQREGERFQLFQYEHFIEKQTTENTADEVTPTSTRKVIIIKLDLRNS